MCAAAWNCWGLREERPGIRRGKGPGAVGGRSGWDMKATRQSDTNTVTPGSRGGFRRRRRGPSKFLQLPEWLAKLPPDVSQENARVRAVERDLGLPVRAIVLLFLSYYLFYSSWFFEAELLRQEVQEIVQWFFVVYAGLNVVAGLLLVIMDEVPFRVTRDVVLGLSLVDAVFLSLLTVVTGGFDSILFWVFVLLIVRNALSMPEATRQILMNLIVCASFGAAGATEVLTKEAELGMLDPGLAQAIYPAGMEAPTEPFLLRVTLLLLMTACCYGVEVLFDRQRRIEEEARESAQRQQQLESAGRMAAEIAHQLKNPLGIINNAAFTLQRTVKEGKTITQQIQIIREEVERSDRIITELMGYARLVEGRVERLNVEEELERAIREVFPPAVKFDVQIHRQYTPALPPLLAQRSHVSEIFVNLLQNAREALQNKGQVWVSTAVGENFSIVVTIADDGPGIPPEQRERVFEAYYTTKEKGTGLGLAIVRHNTELYGGRVRAESELGKGTRFVLEFPARTLMRLRR